MARRAAIAFDIDGVFKYGRQWSGAGLTALRRASEAGIPYVFVTNGGGGLTEATYGEHLKEKVVAAGSAAGVTGDIELPSAARMVLSYTPWESSLVPLYKQKRARACKISCPSSPPQITSYPLTSVGIMPVRPCWLKSMLVTPVEPSMVGKRESAMSLCQPQMVPNELPGVTSQ